MAYEIRDFEDIIDMVMEELKYQSTDTVSTNRIKRDINAVYLDEVVPFKRWHWLSGHTKVQHKAYYNAGTCSVTPESTTVVLSVAPLAITGSRANFLFSVDGFNEIYTISAHTAGSDTITLSSQYNGAINATASYKIWADTIALPTDCKETIEVWQDFYKQPLEAKGLQDFRRVVQESPKSALKPLYYHTYDFYDPTSGTAETESDRYRVLKVHPSMISDTITLHVDYLKEASALDLDADEPLMPYEDRIVLVYGALSRAWARERNPEEALRNERLFKEKLDRMAGKVEDGFDKPQIVPDSLYVRKKRGPRSGGRFRGVGSGSGSSSYTSPSYITNATIGTGNQLTGNLTVSSGVTIDGVDLSVLSSDFTSYVTTTDETLDSLQDEIDAVEEDLENHILDSTGAHAASAISVTPAGNLESTTVQAALEEIQEEVDDFVAGPPVTIDESIARYDGTEGTLDYATATISDAGKLTLNPAAGANTNLTVLDIAHAANQNPTINYRASDTFLGLQFASAGTITARIFNNGYVQGVTGLAVLNGMTLTATAIQLTGGPRINLNSLAAVPGVELTNQSSSTTYTSTVQVTASATAVPTLRVKAIAAQTADLFQNVDSSDAVLSYFDSSGNIHAPFKRTTTAISYGALATDSIIAVTDNTSARTITLAAASALKAGQILIIKDEAGTAASANNITIARAGSDTIDGATSVSITADYGVIRLYSNGSDKYFSF